MSYFQQMMSFHPIFNQKSKSCIFFIEIPLFRHYCWLFLWKYCFSKFLRRLQSPKNSLWEVLEMYQKASPGVWDPTLMVQQHHLWCIYVQNLLYENQNGGLNCFSIFLFHSNKYKFLKYSTQTRIHYLHSYFIYKGAQLGLSWCFSQEPFWIWTVIQSSRKAHSGYISNILEAWGACETFICKILVQDPYF